MKKNLIHYSADDYWNSNPHSRMHIVNSFYKLNYKILWINPIGHRFPSIKQKGFINRIFRKLKSYFKIFKTVRSNFYVFTPILIPKFSIGFTEKVNKYLLKIQISTISTILSINEPLLFFTTPIYGYAIDSHNYSKAIYYYSDKYSTFRELSDSNRYFMKKLDDLLLSKVDLIGCASYLIFEELKQRTNKLVLYLPHAVDFEFFQEALKTEKSPKPLNGIPRPIVGYYGTLTKSTDWETLEFCAKSRPEYSFVIVGRDETFLEDFKNLQNVFMIGKVPFNEIPYYGKEFNVCISPFIRENWIINSSPLKIKEYLSLEKPVISTYIEEVEKIYSDIVFIAKDKFEFLEYIDIALNGENSQRIKKGLELVQKDSWDKMAHKLLDNLNKVNYE